MSGPATVTFCIQADRYTAFIRGVSVPVVDLRLDPETSRCAMVQITLPINEIRIGRATGSASSSVTWTNAPPC